MACTLSYSLYPSRRCPATMDDSSNPSGYDVIIQNLSIGLPSPRSLHFTSLWKPWRRQSEAISDFVLRGVNASVSPGEVMAVLGSSGSGKTTLLHAIVSRVAGLPIINGHVLIVPSCSSSSGPTSCASNAVVGFVSQQDHLLPNLTGAYELFAIASQHI